MKFDPNDDRYDLAKLKERFLRSADTVPERRQVPKLKLNESAFLRKEGAPGTSTRIKRRKPSRGRTRGRETWLAKAKAKHKAERNA